MGKNVLSQLENVVRGFTEREDGWKNLLSGLGVDTKDPTTQTVFTRRARLNQVRLDSMYAQSSIAARISDIPAFYSTKEWIELEMGDNDREQEILAALEAIDAQEIIADLVRWSSHYGGALAVLQIVDGQLPEEPLREASIKAFNGADVINRWDVQGLRVDRDPLSETYGQVTHYSYVDPMKPGKVHVVHASRCLRLDGIKVPKRLLVETDGWGWSVMERVFEDVRAYQSSIRYTENIIRDFTQDVFQITNLSQLLERGKEDQIRERFRIIQVCKSMLNAVVVGAEEKYEKRSTSVQGLDKLLMEFHSTVSSSTGIPVTLLFGRSPAGMNATGESDLRNYYDQVGGFQESKLRKPIRRLIELVSATKKRQMPKDWSFSFAPLWKMSDKERSEIEKNDATKWATYTNAGILEPEEVAMSLFSGEDSEIQLQEGLRVAPDDREQDDDAEADEDAE
jgi:phage-related protein (TIGR01555 family)